MTKLTKHYSFKDFLWTRTELLQFCFTFSPQIQNEYKMYALGVLPSAVVRAAENCAGIPMAVKEWARSGIIET